MSASDGSIMATIITTHIAMKVAVAPPPVWSGIRIQAMDIVHPPGIGMPSAIDPHQAIVPHVLARKSSAHVQKNAQSRRSARRASAGVPEPVILKQPCG